MNKKFLTVIVGAALAAGSAVASAAPTVYGKFNVGIAKADNGDLDTIGVTDDSSRFGIKGDEDLGGGLKAIYLFEQGFDADDGGFSGTTTCGSVNATATGTVAVSCTTVTAGRDVYVGLASSWGSVRLGQFNSAHKAIEFPIELFGDTVGDFTHSVLTDESRVKNNISYTSPDFSGFGFVVESGRGETGDTTAADEQNSSALAVSYKMGPLYVAAATKNWDDNGVTATAFNNLVDTDNSGAVNNVSVLLDKSSKIVASFTMDAFSVFGMFAKTKGEITTGTSLVGDDIDAKVSVLGGSFKFDNNTVGVTLATYEAGGEDLAKQTTVGFIHALSKTTLLKFVHTIIDNEDIAMVSGRVLSNASIGLANPALGDKVTGTQAQLSVTF